MPFLAVLEEVLLPVGLYHVSNPGESIYDPVVDIVDVGIIHVVEDFILHHFVLIRHHEVKIRPLFVYK